MIRKIFLVLLILFVTLWFFGAHLVKNKLIAVMSDLGSDNIKISYQNTKISGFPFFWQVTFVSPKISVIDQKSIRELSARELNVKTDYLIQNIAIDFGRVVNYTRLDGVKDRGEYSFVSNKDMKIDILFQKSLYLSELDSAWKTIASLTRFDLGTINVNSKDGKMFSLSDIKAISEVKQIDSINGMNIKLTGDYDSESEFSKVKKGHLLLDLSYLINNPLLSTSENVDFEHKIELSKLQLKLDDSSLGLRGALHLNRSSLPQGDFDVSLVKYQDVINKIIPEDFIISSSYIKQAVGKATASELGNNVQNVGFKIFFSNKGISIGKVNAFNNSR